MYRSRIEKLDRILMRKTVELENHQTECRKYAQMQEESLHRLESLDAANAVVRKLALDLQDSVREKVQSIVQKAIDATFPGYRFRMKFVTRRDKVDTDFVIADETGNEQNILSSNGGGLKDIVSFALRVAIWSLDHESSSIIVLDEPMKFMSAGCRYQGAELLNVLATDLGLQFIVVSHVPEIIDNATRVYRIQQDKDKVSHAKLVKD